MVDSSHIIAFGSEIRSEKSGPSNRMLAGLRENQIVEAKVVGSTSPRQAELEILGKTVFAQTDIPLKIGQKISLRVTHTGFQPKFQLVEVRAGDFLQLKADSFAAFRRLCPYDALGKLIHNLKGSSGISFGRDALLSIDRLLESITPESDVPDPERIRGFIRKSGLAWEHKLLSVMDAKKHLPQLFLQRFIEKDLKGLCLLLLRVAGKGDFPGAKEVHLFLENIETYQALNRQASDEPGRYLIPIPVLLDQDIRFGQMLVDLGKRPRSEVEEDRLIRVSLLLEMSHLGHLQVDLSILRGAITGLFSVQDDSTRRLIESQIPGLMERLQETGFTVHEMSCRTVSPEELSAASLADRFVEDPHGEGVLSIRV